MKKLFILVLIGLCSFVDLFSQSVAASGMYNKGIILLNKAKTTENFLEAAFYFENLAKEFPHQWLVQYYAGLSYILAGQDALDSKYSDDLLNKAQPLIDIAFSLKPGEPELHILQAFHYQARLQVDPQARAINLAQKADASLKKAIEADSANPRAYFLMANNVYYTPVMFKGGPKNALPVFLKAREKFITYQAEFSFLPKWGEKENEEMIKICNKSKI